jgi:Protein of unknown function (DUF2911)
MELGIVTRRTRTEQHSNGSGRTFHFMHLSATLSGQRIMLMPRLYFVVMIFLMITAVCSAQSEPNSTTTCNLEDGRQVAIRYNTATAKSDRIVNGKPFTPGGAPMTLFTDAPLTFGGSNIPMGAYTVYPIPARDKWTLAINKNVTAGAAYDEKQNIAREPIETDAVPQAAEELQVVFAHTGQKCTLQIYFGKVATFSEFVAK